MNTNSTYLTICEILVMVKTVISKAEYNGIYSTKLPIIWARYTFHTPI